MLRLRKFQILFFCLVFVAGIKAVIAAPQCAKIFADNSSQKPLFSSKHGKIAYQVSGKSDAKTVIVFLNGLDKSLNEWNSVRDLMIEKNPTAAYVQLDLLGQGETARMNESSKIPFTDQIEILREFLKVQGYEGKKLVLVGHSYGGGIAARFIRENPGVVKEAILIAPFVDNLEIHQPGIGSANAMLKAYYESMGLKEVYDQHMQMNFTYGTIMTWNALSFFGLSEGRLPDVLAMTSGIRNLEMSASVAQAGTTRMNLIISSSDELIPTRAHTDLWDHIPESNRGAFLRVSSTHESVVLSPKLIAAAVLDILKRKGK